MTKDELVDRIQSAKAELDDLLAQIPAEEMVAPHPHGEWSGKDQVSHLAAWHEILLARMRGVREEDLLGLEAARYSGMETDELNAFLQQRDAGIGLDDARAAFERTYAEVMALLHSMDQAALDAPIRGSGDSPLTDAIAGDTFEHYEEHIELLAPLAEPR